MFFGFCQHFCDIVPTLSQFLMFCSFTVVSSSFISIYDSIELTFTPSCFTPTVLNSTDMTAAVPFDINSKDQTLYRTDVISCITILTC